MTGKGTSDTDQSLGLTATVPSDLYAIIQYHPLLPTDHAAPGDYTSVGTRARPDGQDSTVDDICDFIVEYINSDILVGHLCKQCMRQYSDLVLGTAVRQASDDRR